MDDAAHARGRGGPEDVLEQRDLVGGELRGVRAADVAVLVIAEQRVDAAGILRGEPGVRDHHFAGLLAIVLAEEVWPVLRLDVRAVNQVAGEDAGARHLRTSISACSKISTMRWKSRMQP